MGGPAGSEPQFRDLGGSRALHRGRRGVLSGLVLAGNGRRPGVHGSRHGRRQACPLHDHLVAARRRARPRDRSRPSADLVVGVGRGPARFRPSARSRAVRPDDGRAGRRLRGPARDRGLVHRLVQDAHPRLAAAGLAVPAHHRAAQSEHDHPVRGAPRGTSRCRLAGRRGVDGAVVPVPPGPPPAGAFQRRNGGELAGVTMNETILRFGYPDTLIAEYRHWLVLLRPDQPTLGSLVLAATGAFTALPDVPPEGFAELRGVVQDIEASLGRTVRYERINYLMLMMVDPHVHWHVVPRYEGIREAAGVTV